jgi:hypothetical protein
MRHGALSIVLTLGVTKKIIYNLKKEKENPIRQKKKKKKNHEDFGIEVFIANTTGLQFWWKCNGCTFIYKISDIILIYPQWTASNPRRIPN